MVGDPVIVGKVRNWVAALEVRGLPAPELAARWQTLLAGLKEHVATFPALPSDGPGQDDVAFCLFLHAMAVRTTRSPDSWPRAVAQRLGIGDSP
jgi:hypothetical protein